MQKFAQYIVINRFKGELRAITNYIQIQNNMFDVSTHKTMMVKLLKSIYTDPVLRTSLGFKGGTAAYLFYNLPRASVDLDFDLLDEKKKDEVFLRVKTIVSALHILEEAMEKRYTLFFLLRYKKGVKNIKIEISKRPIKTTYIQQNYYGISMLVPTKEDMAAHKLLALLNRKKFASRDMFDVWYFLQEEWPINEKIVQEGTGVSLFEALQKAIDLVQKINSSELLQGLGELVNEKQKSFVREKLKDDLLFLLKLARDEKNTSNV